MDMNEAIDAAGTRQAGGWEVRRGEVNIDVGMYVSEILEKQLLLLLMISFACEMCGISFAVFPI